MNWTNIRLIAAREIRDQLRDRRTIFVIAILPLLLYPLLGMSFLQIMQFMREHPTKIWVIGAQGLPAEHQLLEGGSIRADLLATPSDERLFEVSQTPPTQDAVAAARDAVQSGLYDAVVYLPASLSEQISQLAARDAVNKQDIGGPEVYCDMARDKSRVAHDRLLLILARWRAGIIHNNTQLRETNTAEVPLTTIRYDLSEDNGRRAATWSKSCR